ncbi:MAG: 5-formyltetrahydrofolate cyclo-ligase [Oscillospiraceae bacterium]|nr:5-formyltetrahydrofolate cyclo-ligase [Oscillospiraceae bacterium]
MAVDIREIKKSFRAESKAYRRALRLTDKVRMDETIFQQIIALPEYREAKMLITYISTPIEVATFRLVEDALRNGKTVVAPRCVPDRIAMDFYRINGISDLETASFSVLEPKVACCERVSEFPDSICIVPGLLFDDEGFRLGYGKGYYDRFLSNYQGVTVGVCYTACMRERLPRGRFDRSVDLLVTEDKVVRMAVSAKKKSPHSGAFQKSRV